MYVISRKPYVLPNRVGLYFQSWPLVFGSSIEHTPGSGIVSDVVD